MLNLGQDVADVEFYDSGRATEHINISTTPLWRRRLPSSMSAQHAFGNIFLNGQGHVRATRSPHSGPLAHLPSPAQTPAQFLLRPDGVSWTNREVGRTKKVRHTL